MVTGKVCRSGPSDRSQALLGASTRTAGGIDGDGDAPGVHRVGDGTVNFYVLVEGTDLALVDAGLPGHYGRLTAMLEGIGRSVRDVRAVLLTHVHLDHVGLAERLRQQAGATVWVHGRDVPALAHPLRPPADAKPEAGLGRYLLRHPTALRVPVRLRGRGRSARRPSPRPASLTTT